MNLSSDLISQFVKITKDDSKNKNETTVYGTTVDYNGSIYVKLDGSDLLTPISTTADTKAGERVTVLIKDHTATVTGNITSPAARTDDVKENRNKISEFDTIMAYSVTTENLEAINATINSLKVKVGKFSEMSAVLAQIETLQAKFASLDKVNANDVTALNAEIENIKAQFGDFTDISADELSAMNADIATLKGYTADFTYVSADRLTATIALVKDLDAKKLSAESADLEYAKIDFTNIGKAAIEQLYATSGIIKDLVIGDTTITGELVGVTIKGDLIKAGTVKADRLVVLGSDGLYYKLNTNGVSITAEQTEYNSLNGSVITANTITAEKINVDDLVAFDATIGGFHITNSAIHSGVKETVDNTTDGVYLDKTGQMSIGGADNYFKYYKDEDGTYRLTISAESIFFGSSNKSISDLDASIEDTTSRVELESSIIQQLKDSISTLVVDGNGVSLMEQTEDGWVFSMKNTDDILTSISDNLSTLQDDVGSTSATVDILNSAVADLSEISNYVRITTDGDQPCIELGTSDSDFKLRITNTDIRFIEGSSVPTYMNNQSMYIKKAVIEDELSQGGFVWKARSNGNLGLVWKGAEE